MCGWQDSSDTGLGNEQGRSLSEREQASFRFQTHERISSETSQNQKQKAPAIPPHERSREQSFGRSRCPLPGGRGSVGEGPQGQSVDERVSLLCAFLVFFAFSVFFLLHA